MADDDPKDWEPIEDEVPPDPLKRKWEREEIMPKDPVRCQRCGKFSPSAGLRCLFCGTALAHKDVGLLTTIVLWFKSLFK